MTTPERSFETRLMELLEAESDVKVALPFHKANWSAGGIMDGLIVNKHDGSRWEIAIVCTRTANPDSHEQNASYVGPADAGPISEAG